MSLIDEMMAPFVVMNKIHAPDGEGGFTTQWQEGAEIKIAQINDTSMRTQIADALRSASTYTLVTAKANALEINDVVKRKSDNKTFKITSDPEDGAFPSVASELLNKYAKMTAEKWELTT